MFTVKTVINGVTHINERESVTIALPDSDVFKDVLRRTNHAASPDFAVWVPAVYEDAEMKKPLQEEALIVSDRDGVFDEDAIAIMIEGYSSPLKPDVEAFSGQHYQYIYPGDTVYVMNSHGSTIETVK